MNRLTFLILLTALLGAAPLRAQEASFKVAPPSGKTRLAEVFTVKVEASFPGNYSIRPDTSSIDDSAFELLSFTREGASTSAGAKTETFSVKAQAFALGVSTFPALSWTLYDGKGGETAAQSPSFQLEVLPLFKIRADQDIRDIYPPFRYFPWSWLLAGLLLAAAAAALIYKLRARGGAASASASWTDSRTPYQRARERLDKLNASPLTGAASLKEYYIGLTSILRFYLAEEFRIDADLMTTTDLARELKRTGADLKTTLHAREFLQKADLVKFARLKPADAAADARALGDILMEFARAAENAKAAAAAADLAAAGKAAAPEPKR